MAEDEPGAAAAVEAVAGAAVVAPEGAEAPPPPPMPEITSADGWRKATQQRHKVWLPSDVVVVARRLDPTVLVMDGILTGEGLMESMKRGTRDPEELKSRVQTARLVCTRVVVEPQVVLPNDEGSYPANSVTTEDISPTDALALFAWALGMGSSPSEPLD